VILSCNFEELRALASGADLLLSAPFHAYAGPIAAPVAALADVEVLRPRLTGDLSITTLAEQRSIRSAVNLISEGLRERMEASVLEYHPAHEDAVLLYFDYAHTLAVLHRLDLIGGEMAALVELMTGAPADETSARTVAFDD
jgi:hypothetical protein